MSRLGIFLILLLLVFASCRSKFQKSLKNTDPKKKLEQAEYYFNKKDFYRSQLLFEQLEGAYEATNMAEKIAYYMSECDFGLRNYALAGFRYKSYYETYPTGLFAEECLYKHAYCNYLESQDYELDQTDTYKAIETFKIFINVYPDSKYVSECNVLLDQLRTKLSLKAYNSAKLYFNIGDFKSAKVALRNVVNDFPEVTQREEIDFLIVKATYLLAENSMAQIQKQRYDETIEAFYQFSEYYSESSKYMDEAKSYKIKAEIAIKKL